MSKKKKNLWFRMGITLELTEEEFLILRKGSSWPFCAECCEKAEQLLISKMRAGDFRLDGETYSPEQSDWNDETEWPRDEEIGFDLYHSVSSIKSETPPQSENCPDDCSNVCTGASVSAGIINSSVGSVLKKDFLEQIGCWEELNGLSNAQIREMADSPSVPQRIIKQLAESSSFQEAYWEAVSEASFDLVKNYQEKLSDPVVRNTKIRYLYRDAHNYKVHNECIIRGVLSDDQQRQIREALLDEQDFIPSLVGLPEVKFEDYDEEADGPWFELDEDSFEITEQPHTVDTTAEQLTAMFAFYKGKWHQHI